MIGIAAIALASAIGLTELVVSLIMVIKRIIRFRKVTNVQKELKSIKQEQGLAIVHSMK